MVYYPRNSLNLIDSRVSAKARMWHPALITISNTTTVNASEDLFLLGNSLECLDGYISCIDCDGVETDKYKFRSLLPATWNITKFMHANNKRKFSVLYFLQVFFTFFLIIQEFPINLSINAAIFVQAGFTVTSIIVLIILSSDIDRSLLVILRQFDFWFLLLQRAVAIIIC
jgi:hypothetical protein